MSDHTDALKATYGITTTFIRRQAHWLAERVYDGRRISATGASEAEAVRHLLAPSHDTATRHT